MCPAQTTPPGESLTETAFELVERFESGHLTPGFVTRIRRGSSHGVVEVVRDPWGSPSSLMAIRMAIMRPPEGDQGDFFRTLAEMNAEFLGRAGFVLGADGIVWLSAAHPLDDLEPDEMLDLVLWTANMADEVDDALLDQFGRDLAI
jgi:hypothetical protein